MKKKVGIVIVSVLVFLALIVAYKALIAKETHSVLPSETATIDGDKEFAGAEWGLISIICKEGGFNIINYAGQPITLRSSLSISKFYHLTPLEVNKIYAKDTMICEYYTDAIGGLIPGVFAINDSNIAGW